MSLPLLLLSLAIVSSAMLMAACQELPTPIDDLAIGTRTRTRSVIAAVTMSATITRRPPTATLSPSATRAAPLDETPQTPTQEPSATRSPVPPTRTSTPTATTPVPKPSTTPTLAPMPVLPAVAPGLVRHGDRSRPLVALTFDACQTAGAETGYDEAIIRTLTETRTAATLFLGGLWVRSHPTQTQILAGIPFFELGSHSWSHLDFAAISEAEMSTEITRTQEIIYHVTGQQPTLFRLPFGTYTDDSLRVIAEHGLRTIQWDVTTGDPDPNILTEDIVEAVLTRTQNGSIVIMHMNCRGWHTAEALPAIIEGLSELGFQFATVSELLEEPAR